MSGLLNLRVQLMVELKFVVTEKKIGVPLFKGGDDVYSRIEDNMFRMLCLKVLLLENPENMLENVVPFKSEL
ncbi:hypothetical protein L1987_71452 [Smallanthus sonchifolius]|uniref:Uncharacterized protein n=1 Tax=Smallanthus sonchifolius TaxID=185202 RepID=A0ACB9AT41_9ASTR|nr:hypothetical protein L1987_71452 [Smallanthus sonchifolius]